MTGDWRAAWTAALDEMALDVAATESMLAAQHRGVDLPPAAPWQPPVGLGPLPADLRPRAESILARQLAVAEEIAHQLATNRQQTAMVARMETGAAGSGPVYLDCAV